MAGQARACSSSSAHGICGGGGAFVVDVYDANFSPFIRDSRALRSLDNLAQYDYILVCIVDDSAATSVRDSLIAQNVARSKIKHITHYGYTTEYESQFYSYDNQEILNRLANDSFETTTFSQFLDSQIVQQRDGLAFCDFEFKRILRYALHNDAQELESKLIEHYKTQPDRFPIISIAYSLGRSGTTLMTQWLASLGISCYPTNLFKPYFDTPIMGFKTMQAIMQTLQANVKNPYTSDFGATEEMFDVLEYAPTSRITGDNLLRFDVASHVSAASLQHLAATYRAIMDTYQKPFSIKVMPLEIEILEKAFANTLHLVLARDIYTHTLALVNLYNHHLSTLYYYKIYAPKNLDFTKEPLVYAAATLKNALAHRDRVLRDVPESRKIYVSYEDFCRNPKALFETLLKRLAALGYTPPDTTYKGVDRFTISPRNPSKEERAIIDSVFANDSYHITV